jgi:hypothetical protein
MGISGILAIFVESKEQQKWPLLLLLASSVEWHQGDQIGRIFALWVIISRGNFF